jgi:hypothetical protein
MPAQWVQLAGNHELHRLGGHQFQGTCELSDAEVEIMRGWLHDGWPRMAVAMDAAGFQALVTNAGLTRGLWLQLGAPACAADAAARSSS